MCVYIYIYIYIYISCIICIYVYIYIYIYIFRKCIAESVRVVSSQWVDSIFISAPGFAGCTSDVLVSWTVEASARGCV